MRGTIYGWPTAHGITQHAVLDGSNKVITAVVATLAFLACIACGVFLWIHSAKLRKERNRRRRVVVAAVFLDKEDRILVGAHDGMLPMCDIAALSNDDHMRSSKRSVKSSTTSASGDANILGIDLTTGHEAFVTALRLSWSWRTPATAPLVDTGLMTTSGSMGDIRRGSSATVDSGAAVSARRARLDVSKFLELFAASSSQLASSLVGEDGLSRLGVLYDQILTT